jgi:hypothetical protein
MKKCFVIGKGEHVDIGPKVGHGVGQSWVTRYDHALGLLSCLGKKTAERAAAFPAPFDPATRRQDVFEREQVRSLRVEDGALKLAEGNNGGVQRDLP